MLILDEQDEWKKPANKTFNILTTIADEPEVHIERLLDRSFFVDSSENKPSFDYKNHPIMQWLEDNIGNQSKDKPIG